MGVGGEVIEEWLDMWREERIKKLEAQLAEALTLLRELQWLELEPITPTPGHGECPVCFEDASNNHAPDCRLAKVLYGP